MLLRLRGLSSIRSSCRRNDGGRGSRLVCEKRRRLSTNCGGRFTSEAFRSRSISRVALPTALSF